MFSLFSWDNKKILTKTDIHSHLIPKIDDGATDIEDSIKLISQLYLLGYRKLITTPHISDIFPNKKESIIEGYNLLKEELIKRDIKIDIEIAAEYYIDDCFFKLLNSQKLLSFGKERYLLFEFSYFTPPRDVENLIYDIILKGYRPVLAHPERYSYWHDDFTKYRELKDMGLLFQINLNSINGYYNENVKKTVENLIKYSLVDFIGSDTHHINHIKNLKKVLSTSIYKKIFKNNKILNDTI